MIEMETIQLAAGIGAIWTFVWLAVGIMSKGWEQVRIATFVTAWQFLTVPVPWWVDLPAMMVAFLTTEFMWNLSRKAKWN